MPYQEPETCHGASNSLSEKFRESLPTDMARHGRNSSGLSAGNLGQIANACDPRELWPRLRWWPEPLNRYRFSEGRQLQARYCVFGTMVSDTRSARRRRPDCREPMN